MFGGIFIRINKLLAAKSVLYALIVIFFIVLQTNILNQAKFFGAKPNLFIPLVISAAVLESEKFSSVLGLVTGFILDSSFSSPFYFSAVLLFFFGYASSVICRTYLHKSVLNMLLFTLAAVIIRMAFNMFFLIGIWSGFSAADALISYLLPEMVITMLCAPIVFFLVKFTAAKIDYRSYI